MKNGSDISYRFTAMAVGMCVCLLVSNLLEVKVVEICGMPLTAGLFLFPFSYVLNDCITEVWGFRKARFVVWLGFGAVFLSIAVFQLAVWIPSPAYWEQGEAFSAVYDMALRIAVASLTAYLMGSMVNATVMSRMKKLSEGRHFSARAILSSLCGEGVDSLFYFPIAFLGVMPLKKMLLMMVLQSLLKTLYEILLLPLLIPTVKYLKRKENTDVIDTRISYNPFRIKDF